MKNFLKVISVVMIAGLCLALTSDVADVKTIYPVKKLITPTKGFIYELGAGKLLVVFTALTQEQFDAYTVEQQESFVNFIQSVQGNESAQLYEWAQLIPNWVTEEERYNGLLKLSADVSNLPEYIDLMERPYLLTMVLDSGQMSESIFYNQSTLVKLNSLGVCANSFNPAT